MDMNLYAAEALSRQYLAELRASAERQNLARVARRPRRPLRLALGHALIRMGTRLLGGLTEARASA
jgi:hypothetical protein